MLQHHPDRPVAAAVLQSAERGNENPSASPGRLNGSHHGENGGSLLHEDAVGRGASGETPLQGKEATARKQLPTNLLSDCLDRLVAKGLARQVAPPGGKRFAYELKEKGEALLSVLLALKDWGLRWQERTRADLLGEPTGEGAPRLR